MSEGHSERLNAPLPVFFARHKCASGWQSEMLIDVAHRLGLQFGYVHNEESFGHHIGRHVRANNVSLLVFGNAQNSYLPDLPPYRGYQVVRDPRDLLVSAYFSHRNSHELQDWLKEHRKKLVEADRVEGLHLQMDFWLMEYMLNQMREWNFENPNVLELRYEDLVRGPREELRRAYEFIGLFDLGFTDAALSEVLDDHSFEAKSGGRKPGESDEQSHYRHGVPGDWRNHFLPEHVDHFKEKYGDLVVTWGYESETTWTA